MSNELRRPVSNVKSSRDKQCFTLHFERHYFEFKYVRAKGDNYYLTLIPYLGKKVDIYSSFLKTEYFKEEENQPAEEARNYSNDFEWETEASKMNFECAAELF